MHFLFGDKVYFQFIFSRSSLSAVKRIYGLFVSVLAPWVMFGIKGLFFEKQAILSLLFKLSSIFNGKDSKNACNKCISQIKYQLHVLFRHCAKNKYGIPWDGHGQQIEHLANTVLFVQRNWIRRYNWIFLFLLRINTKVLQQG